MNKFAELLKFAGLFESLATKKEDPKAKERNRGKVVFPADSSKVNDSADHFPINTEAQARAALAFAGKYKVNPPWHKGTLAELKEAVRKAVHKHFPTIDISDKKK